MNHCHLPIVYCLLAIAFIFSGSNTLLICRVLAILPKFNFWGMFYLLIKGKKEIDINKIKYVSNELDKNKALQKIYEKYYRLLISYIARKNILTVLVTIPFWKKILDARLSPKNNAYQPAGNNSLVNHHPNDEDCFEAEEYAEFVYYFRSASTKSLLLG